MIVIYIALGIVLAVLILRALPLIAASLVMLAGMLITLAGILVALAIFGAILFGIYAFFDGYWVERGLPLVIIIAAVIIVWASYEAFLRSTTHQIRTLKKSIEKRASLGYGTSELRDELEALIARKCVKTAISQAARMPFKIRVFGSYEEREKFRRRSLGYDE